MLVVIDDDLRLAEVAGLLEASGLTVESLRDPYRAGERVSAVPRPAVILLDVLLPTREVYRLCRRLRAKTQVPMVIASWGDRADIGVGPIDRLVTHSSTAAELVANVLALLELPPIIIPMVRDWPVLAIEGEPEVFPAPGHQR